MPQAAVSIARPPLLQLLDRPRPIVFEQPRQGAVGQQLPPVLTRRTVVRLILRIHDALHTAPAYRTRLVVPAVDRHAVAERRHLLGEALADFAPQTFPPFHAPSLLRVQQPP